MHSRLSYTSGSFKTSLVRTGLDSHERLLTRASSLFFLGWCRGEVFGVTGDNRKQIAAP